MEEESPNILSVGLLAQSIPVEHPSRIAFVRFFIESVFLERRS